MADTVELMRKRVLNMGLSGELTSSDISTWEEISLGDVCKLTNSERKSEGDNIYLHVRFLRGTANEEKRSKGNFVKKDDLVILVDGENSGEIFQLPFDGYMGSTFRKIEYSEEIDTRFLKLFIRSHQELLRNNKTGSAIPHLNKKLFASLAISLPPVAEQKRIVAKIEEIFAVIDQIGTKKEEALSIIRNMRQTALQDAIMGVLVEQDDTDEPASILYEKIQVEKEKLVKEKKIKKEKPLPNIEDDEIPFDIPESWKWVRLKEVVHNHGQKKPDKSFSYIDIGSIDNNRTQLNKEEKIVKPEEAPSRARKIVKFGDILYSTVRPYLHNACIVDREFSEEPIASTGFAVMRTFNGLLNRFLFYYLLSPTFDLYANDSSNATGTAYPAINDTKLYRAVVPLPPLAEQERIAEKIDEIMAICDQMEAIFDGTSEVSEDLKVV